MSYLMTLLEGPAYNVVAGLDLTVENYKHAIETLKSRFGNRQKIVDAHMQALLKLQECPNDNVMNLRRIYDSINVNALWTSVAGDAPRKLRQPVSVRKNETYAQRNHGTSRKKDIGGHLAFERNT